MAVRLAASPACLRPLIVLVCIPQHRRQIVLQSPVAEKRRFQCILIKPSHYDDDGYVIRWWRAMISSNSLARSLRNCGRLRGAAGSWAGRCPDPTSQADRRGEYRASTCRLLLARFRTLRRFRDVLRLVGVQSNQYPRALEHRTTVPGSWNSRRHRRLPRVGMRCRCWGWGAQSELPTLAGTWVSPCSPVRLRAGSIW